MSMMHSTMFLIALMTFLILAVGGALIAVRVYGARQVHGDH